MGSGRFVSYFLKLIFKSKNRQGLLILAVIGLFISSFSLLFLQSTMGGLQHKLVGRSKSIAGTAIVYLSNTQLEEAKALAKEVDQFLVDENEYESSSIVELELEMLLRKNGKVGPILVHGLDQRPAFLREHPRELVVPFDFAIKMGITSLDRVELVSPGHTDAFMEDIPRFSSVKIDDIISTDVPEIDGMHGWIRITLLQNLIREQVANRIRIYSPVSISKFKQKFSGRSEVKSIKSWEEEHQTLVHALRLETTVMVFLFIAMTLLVSLSITGGLLIFLDKVKMDMAGLFILGAGPSMMKKTSRSLVVILGGVSSLLGIFASLIALYLLDQFGSEIMPAVFVDRKIPVYITFKGLLLSFCVPAIIGILFGSLALRRKKREEYLEIIRSVGR